MTKNGVVKRSINPCNKFAMSLPPPLLKLLPHSKGGPLALYRFCSYFSFRLQMIPRLTARDSESLVFLFFGVFLI